MVEVLIVLAIVLLSFLMYTKFKFAFVAVHLNAVLLFSVLISAPPPFEQEIRSISLPGVAVALVTALVTTIWYARSTKEIPTIRSRLLNSLIYCLLTMVIFSLMPPDWRSLPDGVLRDVILLMFIYPTSMFICLSPRLIKLFRKSL